MARLIVIGKPVCMAEPAVTGNATLARLTVKFALPVTIHTRRRFQAGLQLRALTHFIQLSKPRRKGFTKMSITNKSFPPTDNGVSRRSFLRTSTVLASGVAALAASLAPL